MRIAAELHQSSELIQFLMKLNSPEMRTAGARGLNEHAGEQRRQSVVRMATTTGVPKGHVSKVTRVIPAIPSASMVAMVQTQDSAISLAKFGHATWSKSDKGAVATAWNVRRTFPKSFLARGQVMIRTTKSRFPLKILSMAVLANELAKPTRPNVPAAEKFVALDLEKRVLRHVIRALGT